MDIKSNVKTHIKVPDFIISGVQIRDKKDPDYEIIKLKSRHNQAPHLVTY